MTALLAATVAERRPEAKRGPPGSKRKSTMNKPDRSPESGANLVVCPGPEVRQAVLVRIGLQLVGPEKMRMLPPTGQRGRPGRGVRGDAENGCRGLDRTKKFTKMRLLNT